MKFTTSVSIAAVLVASVASLPMQMQKRVDPNLVPQFGVTAGTNPTGTGDCDGINGVKIPCACPPDRQTFINDLNANVAAGHAVNNPGIAVSFPTDNSQASQIARIQASLVTLQNLNGPGVGCPAAATTFLAQQTAIQNGQNAAAAPAPAAPAPPPPAPAADPIAALAPPLGFSAGVNPTGTGDCDGAVGSPPVKIPCSCPPPQDEYIAQLKANVAAGHAVNNPGVAVAFPTGSSKPELAQRIQAALVTLQNLNGPGVGCPAAATTLLAQLTAAQS